MAFTYKLAIKKNLTGNIGFVALIELRSEIDQITIRDGVILRPWKEGFRFIITAGLVAQPDLRNLPSQIGVIFCPAIGANNLVSNLVF